MAKKIRVGVLFGGRSTEHEVSLMSARNVLAALDPKKYEPVLIGIDKTGRWFGDSKGTYLSSAKSPKMLGTGKKDIVPKFDSAQSLDVVFPVLHGPLGEDGTIQGFLRLAGLPFVGPNVLGSAIGMDKDVAKRLLRDAGIGVAEFITLRKYESEEVRFLSVKKKLGLPLFIKPANAGSSVGVSKVRTEKEFYEALKTAFLFDTKILIEKAIVGREIEVAVLGNEHPMASVPGEIIPSADFYSYDAKYSITSESKICIPADISKTVAKKIQTEALKVFQVLELEGMSRVDFFLTEGGEILVNEVNTIPGFTSISMYPKLWEATGIPYSKLIDRLIELAVERFKRDSALQTSLLK